MGDLCISAVRDWLTVVSGAPSGDPRGPRACVRAARMGVRSAPSLPLITPDEVVVAVNICAHAQQVFFERAAGPGDRDAGAAAVPVPDSRVLEDTRRLADRLHTALGERMVIERAVGIVLSRSGVNETEALARLVELSQHDHVTLFQIARNLIDEAARGL